MLSACFLFILSNMYKVSDSRLGKLFPVPAFFKEEPSMQVAAVSTGKPLHLTLSVIVAISWDKVSLSF